MAQLNPYLHQIQDMASLMSHQVAVRQLLQNFIMKFWFHSFHNFDFTILNIPDDFDNGNDAGQWSSSGLVL